MRDELVNLLGNDMKFGRTRNLGLFVKEISIFKHTSQIRTNSY